ncbi:hypothetical protein N183_35845 [Sinorhizobium sp. Sb3]|nr:hypothetical protein N183_35845 [Sinorhizobium sp. Sb3]
MRADQENDGEFEAATAHQIDKGGCLALHALLAPIDHHATDGRVRLDGDFGVFKIACAHHLETGPFDLLNDLVVAGPLQVLAVEGGCREQKGEAPEIVHLSLRHLYEASCSCVS